MVLDYKMHLHFLFKIVHKDERSSWEPVENWNRICQNGFILPFLIVLRFFQAQRFDEDLNLLFHKFGPGMKLSFWNINCGIDQVWFKILNEQQTYTKEIVLR